MTGYTRNDTTNNIANGNVINAADLDGEFDAIQSAFDASTGHAHDGTVGGGAPIEALGPAQDVVITTSVLRPKTDNTVDLGTSTLEFKDLYLDGTAKVDTLTVDESATITANLTVNGNTTLGNAATDTVTVTADVASHLIPATDNTYDLGGASDEWRNLYIDGTAQVDTLQVDESATITADLTVNGNTTLGNATTDTLTLTAQLATSVLPSTDDAVDLGSSSKEWRDLYVDGTANIDTLVADTATISAGTATLSAGTIITSTGGTLTLQRDDTAITTGETLGEIDFQAPNVSGGGDAVVVAATIRAVARDTFDAAVNKTSLLFETANSGAVTTRMEIDGTGNVAVDTDTLYVDAVNDRVGINTASPTTALEVNGDVTIADKIVHSGDTNTSIRFPAADTVTVETSGAERLRIDSAGNAGLGVTPSAWRNSAGADLALQVRGAALVGYGNYAADLTLNAYLDSASTWRYIASGEQAFRYSFLNDGSFAWFNAPSGTAGNAITFTQAMTLDANGDLGIGTSSPSFKLDIQAVTDPTVRIYSTGTGVSDDSLLRLQIAGTTASNYIQFGDSADSDAGYIKYDHTSDSLAVGVNAAERMRIDSSGNVGVGTSSPSSYNGTASTRVLAVGTTSGNNGVNVISGTTSTGSYLFSDSGGNDRGGLIYYHTADTMTMLTNGTERMRIDASGNLGLGVTPSDWGAASTAIQVAGNMAYSRYGHSINAYYDGTSYRYISSGAFAALYQPSQTTGAHGWFTAPSGTAGNPITFTQAMTLDADGDLGIGTTSPAARLHVNGGDGNHIRYSGATNSVAMGMTGANPFIGSLTSAPLLFLTGGSERARIDASGNVGIGTSSPSQPLTVAGNIYVNGADGEGLIFNGSMGIFRASSTSLAFNTGGSERARIDASGNFLVGKTAANVVNAGFEASSLGKARATVSADACIVVNRLTDDGNLVQFLQAGTLEGSISVSGTTVSYNGGHLSRWAQLPDNSRPDLLKGTVMSNLDQMSNWDNEDNEQLNCVQVSTVEGDPNVAGVFVAWDSTDDEYNDILLAMTGDMVIRIAAGTTVQRGDLLMSAGDGTAKPQGDDIVRSKTIAKVTSTHVSHTYEDGSYAVPCVLMAC